MGSPQATDPPLHPPWSAEGSWPRKTRRRHLPREYYRQARSPLEREGFEPSGPVAETILEETASARRRFGSSSASRAHKGAAPDGSGLRSSRSL
jgi:hypothetical protein